MQTIAIDPSNFSLLSFAANDAAACPPPTITTFFILHPITLVAGRFDLILSVYLIINMGSSKK